MQNVNAMDLLREEMQTDDIATKVNTVHKLPIVVSLMTVDSIKNQLLPYLENLIKKQDDEVVFAIAQELANVAYCPALNNQHTLVLGLLETLCAHDETVIRDRAVKTVLRIVEKCSDNEVQNFVLPLVFRLASNQTNFVCRVSAVHLIASVYARGMQNKEKLRQKFIDISNEEMLLVQRVTTTKIPHMCKVYEKQYIVQDLLTVLKNRANDQQDQIRVLATECYKQVAKFLQREENKTYIMPLIIQAAEDKSWRVRLCLSKNFTEIAKGFGKQVAEASLIQTYGNLLKDVEVDVKIEAVKSLSSFVEIVSPDKVSGLLAQVIALSKDSLTIVRANASLVLKSMIPAVSKDQAYQNIQPLIKQLMKDQNQQVRKGGIEAAAKFVEVIGADAITSLYQSLKTCSEDTKWRVRLQLVEKLCQVAANVQNYEMYTKHIEPLYLNFLTDRATGVRNAGIRAVPQLVRAFGDVWVNAFIPKLEDILSKEVSYHFKIGAIYSLKQIALSQIGDKYVDKCLSAIFKASNSQVPNIREVVIKSLRDISARYERPAIRDAIKKQIVALANDSDYQVKTTASELLAKL